MRVGHLCPSSVLVSKPSAHISHRDSEGAQDADLSLLLEESI